MRLGLGIEAMPRLITEAKKVWSEGGSAPGYGPGWKSANVEQRVDTDEAGRVRLGVMLLLERGLTCSLVNNTPEPSASFSV